MCPNQTSIGILAIFAISAVWAPLTKAQNPLPVEVDFKLSGRLPKLFFGKEETAEEVLRRDGSGGFRAGFCRIWHESSCISR